MRKQLHLLEKQQHLTETSNPPVVEVIGHVTTNDHGVNRARSSSLFSSSRAPMQPSTTGSRYDGDPIIIGGQPYFGTSDTNSTRSNSYLKQLEREYILQIDKYKQLLEEENDKLKSTRREFVDYVQDKSKEIDTLQDQIRGLKGVFVRQWNLHACA